MAGSSGGASADGRKRARIEIIPLIDIIFRPRRRRESKAEQKTREKRKRIVELQYLHGEKPEVIARCLDVGLRFVYNTTLFLRNKLQLKKGMPSDPACLPP